MDTPISRPTKVKPSTASQSRPRVLVAEDELLIALLIEEDLRRSGFFIIGPFADLEEAEWTASTAEIDVAVLDINMNGHVSFQIADRLSTRGIPFVFLSGYGPASVPQRYRNAPMIAKPHDPRLLVNMVWQLARVEI